MTRPLRELAAELGVQSSYTDTMGRRRVADVEALLAVVNALGVEVTDPAEAPALLARVRAQRDARPIEPVVVVWDGRLALRIRGRATEPVALRLELEDGTERGGRVEPRRAGDGTSVLALRERVPIGVHRLELSFGGRRLPAGAIVLSAPRRIAASPGRRWGVFLPLHALVTERTWGVGDLTGLAELADWVRSIGGGMVATLPLLAAFADEPSPYSPASRLFWDERYVDVERAAEGDASARRLISSGRFRHELDAVRSSDPVDLERVLALKREALERLATSRADDPGLRRFLRERPDAETYARFRAAGERWGRDWRSWPAAARDGRASARGLEPSAIAYHRFAQFVAEDQMAELGRRTRAAGAGLYLDIPLGAHADGYDVWRYRDAFATGVSVGAPPDDFFRAGQDWGFPPLHPLRVREDGYRYVRACLRHVLRHAGVVRIDHIIGLHRRYLVPQGMSADRGVFVRYPADEWYAVLSLEAARYGTVVVGEDLGTVPKQVPAAMRRHGVLGSYVLQYEAVPSVDRVPLPAAEALASVNTHDMPTFAAFWRGIDIDDRVADGLLSPHDAERERRERDRIRATLVATLREAGVLGETDDEREVLAAALEWLSRSDARLVSVTLEDLWGELRPVNVPGITDRPNWRGRAARSLERFRRDPDVLGVLRRVDAARTAEPARPSTPDEDAA